MILNEGIDICLNSDTYKCLVRQSHEALHFDGDNWVRLLGGTVKKFTKNDKESNLWRVIDLNEYIKEMKNYRRAHINEPYPVDYYCICKGEGCEVCQKAVFEFKISYGREVKS